MGNKRKYKASRFEYKTEKEAAHAISNTKRGKGKKIVGMKTHHSNTEWIFYDSIE